MQRNLADRSIERFRAYLRRKELETPTLLQHVFDDGSETIEVKRYVNLA